MSLRSRIQRLEQETARQAKRIATPEARNLTSEPAAAQDPRWTALLDEWLTIIAMEWPRAGAAADVDAALRELHPRLLQHDRYRELTALLVEFGHGIWDMEYLDSRLADRFTQPLQANANDPADLPQAALACASSHNGH